MATNNSAQVRGNYVVGGVVCGLLNISRRSISVIPFTGYTVKKYPHIHGYIVASFPYVNGTVTSVCVCRPIRKSNRWNNEARALASLFRLAISISLRMTNCSWSERGRGHVEVKR